MDATPRATALSEELNTSLSGVAAPSTGEGSQSSVPGSAGCLELVEPDPATVSGVVVSTAMTSSVNRTLDEEVDGGALVSDAVLARLGASSTSSSTSSSSSTTNKATSSPCLLGDDGVVVLLVVLGLALLAVAVDVAAPSPCPWPALAMEALSMGGRSMYNERKAKERKGKETERWD